MAPFARPVWISSPAHALLDTPSFPCVFGGSKSPTTHCLQSAPPPHLHPYTMSDESTAKRTRASGEVLDFLLREFDLNQNPTPDMRKDISERTGMTEKAVRIWFQNRRAKLRKFERMGKPVKTAASPATRTYPPSASGHLSRSNLSTNIATNPRPAAIPIELNDKYCFIECLSLSVGTWQRIISGHHDPQVLQHQLVNLSPFTLNNVMQSVDLMVILSRRNLELNYFFSAVSNNSKILFRIFYPLASVLLCLLLDNSVSKDNSELRLSLARPPKFSVYFFNGVNANLNQWSICDDFLEGQQVSTAFYAQGGTSTPHVLVGAKASLQYLNAFILDHNHVPAPYAAIPQALHEYPPGKGFMLDTDPHQNANYPLKHDHWDEPSEYRVLPMAPYDGQSPGPQAGPRKVYAPAKSEKKDYDDMFATGTPDFFNAVPTPANGGNLANSPSTAVQPFARDKNNTQRPPRGNLDMNFEQEGMYSAAPPEQPYGYEMAHESQEFQSTDLIASPQASNAGVSPNPGALANHVDNYIDYGAHY